MPYAPRASYRVQLEPRFGFEAATVIVDYLAELGISHMYCSPCMQAARGSTHGYDVVDPTRVSEELGSSEGHARLCDALARQAMGLLLDIVPNHMAITRDNPWWWDVLENGASSRYASYFDVDWNAIDEPPGERILLPVLQDHYGRALEAGELCLRRENGGFRVRHHDVAFPVAPASFRDILGLAADKAGSDTLAFLADAFACLSSAALAPPDADRRHRNKEVLRRQFARFLAETPEAAAAVDAAVAEINGDIDALDRLLERQHYRLAYWRTAVQEIGYRRFFDINTLIGLRVEEACVFRDSHALLLEWVRRGLVAGLRIDHPDGLRDPEGYLHRLCGAAPETWIVVEKVLEPGERLRGSWPIGGTTGYDFLNLVGGLFIDAAGEPELTRLYADFTGEPASYREQLHDKKVQVLRELLGGEVNRLTELLHAVCERYRRHRDHTRDTLREAIRETIACFPVYRTYVRAAAGTADEEDARHVRAAIGAAKARRPELDEELLDFLADLLLLRHRGRLEDEFVMRFQQLTGPAMAKGAEDTAFYTYNRLVCLNEVGGAPDRFGTTAAEFHRWAAETGRRWPHTLLATSTHDTKRSGDVRARLALLSEIPGRWREAVGRWSAMNAHHRRADLPDRNTEYLLYQTLVGAWPLDPGRILAYMEKAVREAKVHTSWLRIDEAYETAVADFVTAILADSDFVADLAGFVASLAWPGRLNSLAQTLIKLTAPGVPDIYQGDEIWNLSLVDPDNRRPVDYRLRRRLLTEMAEVTPEEVLARSDEGLPKLWVVHHGLRVRQRLPRAFGPRSDYTPVAVRGDRAAHAVAFSRGAGRVVTVVPRLVIGLDGDWRDTGIDIAPGRWRNELTGEDTDGGSTRLGRLLARFPLALLVRQEHRS